MDVGVDSLDHRGMEGNGERARKSTAKVSILLDNNNIDLFKIIPGNPVRSFGVSDHHNCDCCCHYGV